MKFVFTDIQNATHSPGNIFWRKKTGAKVLVAKKGELLNMDLLKRLDESGSDLSVEMSDEFFRYEEIQGFYDSYCEEIAVKKKITWRNRIIEALSKEFIEKKDIYQTDLDQLTWSLFSNLSSEEKDALEGKNPEVFKRQVSLVGTYTLCAFLLGYYDQIFLRYIFYSALINLMSLGEGEPPLFLKDKLEHFRKSEFFDEADYEYIGKISSIELLSKSVIFEKLNGAGLRGLNAREMSDLEIIFIALSDAFSFDESLPANAISLIKSGKINCPRRVLITLQRVLETKDDGYTDIAV